MYSSRKNYYWFNISILLSLMTLSVLAQVKIGIMTNTVTQNEEYRQHSVLAMVRNI